MTNMKETIRETQAGRTAGATTETIISNCGKLTWEVVRIDRRPEGKKKKINRAIYTVACSVCGFEVTASKAYVKKRKACPGRSGKPTALKTDPAGHCLYICDIETVEFIRGYQQEHCVSERAAVRHKINLSQKLTRVPPQTAMRPQRGSGWLQNLKPSEGFWQNIFQTTSW